MEETHPGHKSTRLTAWAYNRTAHYYLTLCCHQRQSLFGKIVEDEMVLSPYGEIALAELLRSVELRQELAIDTFQIMPNHIHLVVVLQGVDTGKLGYARQRLERETKSISSFVAGYKSAVTSAIRRLGSGAIVVWQRGFYDHIVRTERALQAIRQYIVDNPRKWVLDTLHPHRPAGMRDEIAAVLEADSKIPWAED